MNLLHDGFGLAQLALYVAVLVAVAPSLGIGIAKMIDPRRTADCCERAWLRLAGPGAGNDMSASRYIAAILLFNVVGLMVVFALQLFQGVLPANPTGAVGVSWDLALNTAISFVTNTNWQAYAGETTLSYLVQAAALGVQNFLSAATGMAVLVALTRGFYRERSGMIGNAWIDLWRSTMYVLVPLSILLSIVLVSQGVVQTWRAPPVAQLVEPLTVLDGKSETKIITEQTIAVGPVASQEAIKMLGSNGGGFFNANSAHPFENPTPLSNLLECLAILAIPAALCFTFAHLIGDRRQGWALFSVMGGIFVVALIGCAWAESAGNPRLADLGLSDTGNWEGKEVRFGILPSALWATATTAASNGSVNAMHDSFTPLGGLVPMVLMQLGEVVFGGVGSGLYGLLLFALVAVFVAGLMVGRTPSYLGKKIEAREMQLVALGLVGPSLMVLVGTAVAVSTDAGRAGIMNPGAHGFSEILYALSSATNNNGSAFAGLSANTPFYNVLLGVAMLIGRFAVLIPVLAIAGGLAAKGRTPETAGTLPTHRPLFVFLLIAVVILLGVLTFLPALALGPIAAHLEMIK